MRRLPRFISIAGMVTLGLGAVPLLASAATQPTAEATESTASPMHGSGKLIDKALEEVRLRPDQRTQVESMKAEAEKRRAPIKAAEDRLAMAVADQIEQGELDPTQRAAFVDALERQWQSIQKMHEPSALAGKMATDLKLSDDQKTSLEKILTGLREVREAEPSHAAHHERWAKILSNFKGDRSVFDGLAPEKDVAAHTAAKVERKLWAGEAILPVLNPDQRKSVADKIREWAKGTQGSAGMSPNEE